MDKLIRILFVEDSEDDVILLTRHIQRAGYKVVYKRVEDEVTMDKMLKDEIWDIVIADYSLPSFNGLAALEVIKRNKIDLPFIIVSGTIGEDIAVQAMKAGAHDYVMKGNLTRLIPAIQRELVEADIRRERRVAEEALKEAENRYRGLFEGSKDTIFFSDANGIFLDINPAGIELFGYKSREEMFSSAVNLNTLLGQEIYNKRMEILQSKGLLKDYEYTLKRKDGTTAVVLENTTAVKDLNDNIIMYRSILRDITKQKQLEQQFIQAQKMKSIGTLAGGIAHDFNNILGIIMGYCGLLEMYRTKPKEFSEGLSAIIQAAERGASLVQKILTFARQTEVTFRLIDLAEVSKEVIEMLKDTFPKTIKIEGKFEENIPYIYADSNQIHQVLLNLCLNSRDALPNGGLIFIKAELQNNEKVKEKFPSADREQYVCLSVMDNGVGMSEEVRSRIFDPFFTTKENGKGTGLGLSVVYGVMQSHLGFIDVESKINYGTTFRLYFPVPAKSVSQADFQKQMDAFKLEGTETILFVEDEEFIRNMMRLTLESKGYKVIIAEDGNSAVDIYKNHFNEIDLVVTDFGLPGMTGMNEFKKLKEINPDVLVIFTTGSLEPDIKNQLLADGAKAFVQKPYQPDDILKKIREVLDENLRRNF